MVKEMKAISVRQPWAWLIVNGYKDIENRSRNTKHRGRTLIHASKKFDNAGYRRIRKDFPLIKMPFFNGWVNEFPMGGIVGAVNIIACVDTHTSRWKDPSSKGYVLRNHQQLPLVHMPGKLGFFTVTDERIKL